MAAISRRKVFYPTCGSELMTIPGGGRFRRSVTAITPVSSSVHFKDRQTDSWLPYKRCLFPLVFSKDAKTASLFCLKAFLAILGLSSTLIYGAFGEFSQPASYSDQTLGAV